MTIDLAVRVLALCVVLAGAETLHGIEDALVLVLALGPSLTR